MEDEEKEKEGKAEALGLFELLYWEAEGELGEAILEEGDFLAESGASPSEGGRGREGEGVKEKRGFSKK